MPEFLVEVYAPRKAEFSELVTLARAAAGHGSSCGRIRYLDSILIPEDETCFHVFRGPSAAAVATVAKCSGLRLQRVAGPVLQQSADTPGGSHVSSSSS